MDEPRANFVTQYIMARITHVTGALNIKSVCDDADYAWDCVTDPRPLPQAQVTPIKKEATT